MVLSRFTGKLSYSVLRIISCANNHKKNCKGPVQRERKAGQHFGFVTVRPSGTVVTNGQPFLQGNHSLTSGAKWNSCYVVPNSHSVYTFLKLKETVICIGERIGTVPSEQALSNRVLSLGFSREISEK